MYIKNESIKRWKNKKISGEIANGSKTPAERFSDKSKTKKSLLKKMDAKMNKFLILIVMD